MSFHQKTMFLCSSQRATLPSGMMWIVWRNAEPLYPREMSVLNCPANLSVYCKISHTPCQSHPAFNLSQNLGNRDVTNNVLHGLYWEPDIWVLIVVIRLFMFFTGFGLYAYRPLKIHTSDSKLCISWTPSDNKLPNFFKN